MSTSELARLRADNEDLRLKVAALRIERDQLRKACKTAREVLRAVDAMDLIDDQVIERLTAALGE